MTVLIGVETVLLAVLTVLVAGLLRAYATVLQRLHALDGGAAAPRPGGTFGLLPVLATSGAAAHSGFEAAHDIVGATLDGGVASARVAEVEHDTLLLFLSSGCASCAAFWAELERPESLGLPADVRLLVVPQSASEESLTDLVALAPGGVDVILSTAAWREYAVPGSPHAVFVDGTSGRIRGEGTGQSLRQVVQMLGRSGTGSAVAVGPAAAPSTLRATSPAVTSRADRSSAMSTTALSKSARDAAQEAAVDRELLAAGIVPGDPRLYSTASPEDAG